MTMRQPYLASTHRHGDGVSYVGDKPPGSAEAAEAIARTRARLAADAGRKGIRLETTPARESVVRGATRTEQIMRVIQRLTADGLPTTVRAVADACSISTSTVTYHLELLEGRGNIKRDAGLARSIRPAGAWRLTDDERATLRAVHAELQRHIDTGDCDLDTDALTAFTRLAEGR